LEKVKTYDSVINAGINNIGKEVGNVIEWIEDTLEFVKENTLFEIKVILNELLTNAVKHGSKSDRSRFVKVSARIKDNCLFLLEVEDDGEGCDYKSALLEAQNQCSCEDVLNMKETGRGLLLVKNLCDSMKFNVKGNRIIIEKELS